MLPWYGRGASGLCSGHPTSYLSLCRLSLPRPYPCLALSYAVFTHSGHSMIKGCQHPIQSINWWAMKARDLQQNKHPNPTQIPIPIPYKGSQTNAGKVCSSSPRLCFALLLCFVLCFVCFSLQRWSFFQLPFPCWLTRRTHLLSLLLDVGTNKSSDDQQRG